jgi:aspartyl-tRNA synthetase
MSYPQPERVWEVVEGFLTAAFQVAGHAIKTPFPRMTYDEAIRMYGSDKPDRRFPAMIDVRASFDDQQRDRLKLGGEEPILQIRIPRVGQVSGTERRKIIDEIRQNSKLRTIDYYSLQKDEALAAASTRVDELYDQSAQAGQPNEGFAPHAADDFVILVAGKQSLPEHPSEGGVKPEVKQHDKALFTSAGQLRLELARRYAERHGAFKKTGDPAKDFRFLWVTDFPMFEYDEEGKRWAAAHHPFTSPHERDMDKLESNPGAVRALAYDVVLNGTELGSGSIRIHRQDIQQKIFHALGMSEQEAKARFGFFLEALEYGTPPHGGIALGLDRIVMILAGADSLREVIPFPKTARAVDLMVDAPTRVSDAQLKELGIQVKR